MTKITDALFHLEKSSLVSKEVINNLANASIEYFYQSLAESPEVSVGKKIVKQQRSTGSEGAIADERCTTTPS